MLMLWLLACGGDGEGTGDTAPAETADTGPLVDTYDADWAGMQAFFADHCVSCHPATNGIDLEEDIDTYVVAGAPEASRLWESVQALSISTMMPPSGRLPDETIEHVEAWIQAGAVRP